MTKLMDYVSAYCIYLLVWAIVTTIASWLFYATFAFLIFGTLNPSIKELIGGMLGLFISGPTQFVLYTLPFGAIHLVLLYLVDAKNTNQEHKLFYSSIEIGAILGILQMVMFLALILKHQQSLFDAVAVLIGAIASGCAVGFYWESRIRYHP